MTEENKRANIAEELAKATEVWRAAEVMFVNGFYGETAARAYYHALHCAQALLLSLGLQSRTHAGVATLVSQHFVKTGRLDAKTAGLLPHLETDRVLADYDAAAVFTREMAEEKLEQARRYGDAVRAILAAEGYT